MLIVFGFVPSPQPVTWKILPLWVSNLYGFLQMLLRKLAVEHLMLSQVVKL